MKKVILLFTLFSFGYSIEKWEYLMGEFDSQNGFMAIDSDYEDDGLFDKYRTLIERGDKDLSYYSRIALKEALNKLGMDGWELINIAQTPLNPAKSQRELKSPRLASIFYFKRKITN